MLTGAQSDAEAQAFLDEVSAKVDAERAADPEKYQRDLARVGQEMERIAADNARRAKYRRGR